MSDGEDDLLNFDFLGSGKNDKKQQRKTKRKSSTSMGSSSSSMDDHEPGSDMELGSLKKKRKKKKKKKKRKSMNKEHSKSSTKNDKRDDTGTDRPALLNSDSEQEFEFKTEPIRGSSKKSEQSSSKKKRARKELNPTDEEGARKMADQNERFLDKKTCTPKDLVFVKIADHSEKFGAGRMTRGAWFARCHARLDLFTMEEKNYIITKHWWPIPDNMKLLTLVNW